MIAPLEITYQENKNIQFQANFLNKYNEIDANYEHKYVEAGNVYWHYVETGNQNDEVILLVHGLPESWYTWKNVIPLLNKNYRIIAIDMKGYGRSIAYDNNYEWHYVASQMFDFLNALGIEKVHLVGHDWGAIITSMMAGDKPERMLSFTRMQADIFPVDLNFTMYKIKPQFLVFANNWIGDFLLNQTNLFMNICYEANLVAKQLNSEDRNYLEYDFGRKGVGSAAAKYFIRSNYDNYALFDKIAYNNFDFPVMQIQGGLDPTMPWYLFKDMAKKCPNVELVWIEDASHFSTWDNPQKVAEAINKNIAKTR